MKYANKSWKLFSRWKIYFQFCKQCDCSSIQLICVSAHETRCLPMRFISNFKFWFQMSTHSLFVFVYHCRWTCSTYLRRIHLFSRIFELCPNSTDKSFAKTPNMLWSLLSFIRHYRDYRWERNIFSYSEFSKFRWNVDKGQMATEKQVIIQCIVLANIYVSDCE